MSNHTTLKEQFAGDKKKGKSLLWDIEQKIIKKIVPKVPQWMQSYHLTLFTIPCSGLIIFFSFLAKYNIHWLWGVSLMIFFQWLTDSLDGALGRYRNTGLIKWGYYMDHFLDYIFLSSILIGYSFILPDNFKYQLFFILMMFGAFMVNAYLSFAATNEFRISYLKIGPTEVRILFIAINTLLIIFGKTYLHQALPFVLVYSFLGLFVVVYRTQKRLWEIDMENKKKSANI